MVTAGHRREGSELDADELLDVGGFEARGGQHGTPSRSPIPGGAMPSTASRIGRSGSPLVSWRQSAPPRAPELACATARPHCPSWRAKRSVHEPLERRSLASLGSGPISRIPKRPESMLQIPKCWEFAMSDHHFWLSEAQFSRLEPLLPNKPRGVPSGGRPAGDFGDHSCHPGRADVAGRARRSTGRRRRSTTASSAGAGSASSTGSSPRWRARARRRTR